MIHAGVGGGGGQPLPTITDPDFAGFTYCFPSSDLQASDVLQRIKPEEVCWNYIAQIITGYSRKWIDEQLLARPPP